MEEERVEAGEESRRYMRARLAPNKGAASLVSQPRIHGRALVARDVTRSFHIGFETDIVFFSLSARIRGFR